ncbi:hypothetical protein BN10_500014 [Phycicoccus elongatus Lp2]|uniref:Mini-circle protein n=1 Tax=Phycicoccus elongatus Lp2 TaxID=1193181 RepID=N0DZK1_9MICO|nr:hypothetical protein BN10_500014 [Phycicoccus elongatus Lp2]
MVGVGPERHTLEHGLRSHEPGPSRSRRPSRHAAEPTLRWIIAHMIEETARHAGHLDILRELLDGEKAYF